MQKAEPVGSVFCCGKLLFILESVKNMSFYDSLRAALRAVARMHSACGRL